MARPKLFWLIEGRNIDHELIFRESYPLSLYSDQQMGHLLQALAAKSSLRFREVAGALCRKNKRTSLLEVRKLSGPCFTLACGPQLEWTARALPEGDVRLKQPSIAEPSD